MKQVIVKKGKELSNKTIKEVFEIWKKAFKQKPEQRKKFAEDTFFFLYSANKLLSVGRLKPVKVRFLGKNYNISGIADVVSVIKRKGYGKRLMKAIKKHLKKHKKTGVGFCFRKNSLFYKKCGFNIAKNQVKRWVYRKIKKSHGGEDINNINVDVIYLAGKDKFIEQFIKNKKELVKIPIPHW